MREYKNLINFCVATMKITRKRIKLEWTIHFFHESFPCVTWFVDATRVSEKSILR